MSLENLIKKDRLILIGGLSFVVIISALYIIFGVGMSMGSHWDFKYFTLMFFMWWIMMIAMMVPSASPTILLFAALKRQPKASGSVYYGTSLFLGGYLTAWGGFSLMATTLQWQLELEGLMAPMTMTLTHKYLGIGILIAAGIYQFLPLKQACLNHCRDPIQFLTERRRGGKMGPFLMGFEHGLFCLGCCWFLMALLFLGGVMNLYWVGGLALFVLVEKLMPSGQWIGKALGVVLIVLGGFWLSL